MLKKYFSPFLFSFVAISGFVQAKEIPAPKQSNFVSSFNLPFIFSQLSEGKMNQSETGRQLYQALLPRDYNYDSDLDITKSGLDHTRNAWFHYVATDSVNYSLRLLPIGNMKDFAKVAQITDKTKKTAHSKGNFYQLFNNYTLFIDSTESYALLIEYTTNYNAFQDSARAARWGMPYYGDDYAVEVTEEAVPALEYPPVEATEVTESEWQSDAYRATDANEVAMVEDTDVAVEAWIDTGTNASEIDQEETGYTDDYSLEYALEQAKKDSIMTIWMYQFLDEVVTDNIGSEQLLRSLKDWEAPNKNAAVTTYMKSGFMDLFYLAKYFGLPKYAMFLNSEEHGMENWSKFDLVFDETTARIQFCTRMEDKLAATSKRIYKRKWNKRFNKYLNSDKNVAVFGLKMNTQNYLEESPNLMKKMGENIPKIDAEIALFADLFGIIVDEKAMGELISGDAVVAVTEIKEQSYESVKYNWNEETFESSEEKVMKTEMLPHILMMMTTKDEAAVDRLLQYGIKRGAYEQKEGIYYLKNKMSTYNPFQFCFTVYKGIIFVSTDNKLLSDVRLGKISGKMNKQHKKLVKKNVSMGWLKFDELAGVWDNNMNKDGQSSIRTIRINNTLKSLGTLYFNTSKIKGNKMYGAASLSLGQKKTNTMEYFFYLMDDLRQIND